MRRVDVSVNQRIGPNVEISISFYRVTQEDVNNGRCDRRRRAERERIF